MQTPEVNEVRMECGLMFRCVQYDKFFLGRSR